VRPRQEACGGVPSLSRDQRCCRQGGGARCGFPPGWHQAPGSIAASGGQQAKVAGAGVGWAAPVERRTPDRRRVAVHSTEQVRDRGCGAPKAPAAGGRNAASRLCEANSRSSDRARISLFAGAAAAGAAPPSSTAFEKRRLPGRTSHRRRGEQAATNASFMQTARWPPIQRFQAFESATAAGRVSVQRDPARLAKAMAVVKAGSGLFRYGRFADSSNAFLRSRPAVATQGAVLPMSAVAREWRRAIGLAPRPWARPREPSGFARTAGELRHSSPCAGGNQVQLLPRPAAEGPCRPDAQRRWRHRLVRMAGGDLASQPSARIGRGRARLRGWRGDKLFASVGLADAPKGSPRDAARRARRAGPAQASRAEGRKRNGGSQSRIAGGRNTTPIFWSEKRDETTAPACRADTEFRCSGKEKSRRKCWDRIAFRALAWPAPAGIDSHAGSSRTALWNDQRPVRGEW